MQGISSKAAGVQEGKKRFQGQELAHNEFSDGSGLEMYEFKYRMADPQTGRFWQVDPLADKYVYNSTYAFSENKVTTHVEIEGLEAEIIHWIINKIIQGNITTLDAVGAARRLETGQSNQPNTPAPRQIQGVQSTLNTVNDVNTAIQPVVNVAQVTTIFGTTVTGTDAVKDGIDLVQALSQGDYKSATFAVGALLIPGINGTELKITSKTPISWVDDVSPLKGATYTDKVLEQMASDKHHGFPLWVDALVNSDRATLTTIKGGDGVERTLVQIKGLVNDKRGIFEYIINPDNTINHRLFREQ